MTIGQSILEELRLIDEDTPGTTPAVASGEAIVMPWDDLGSFGLTQDFLDNDTATGDRIGSIPDYGARSVGGTITVPMDSRNIGNWLKLILNDPVTAAVAVPTATLTHQHTFTPIKEEGALNSATLEVYSKDLSIGAQYKGVVVNQATINWAPNTNLTLSLDLLGLNETRITSSTGTSPTIRALNKFSANNATISVGGAVVGVVESFSARLNNNVDGDIRTSSSGADRYELPKGEFVIEGEMTIFHEDATFIERANTGAEGETSLSLTAPGGHMMTVTLHQTRFTRSGGLQRSGKGSIRESLNFRAYLNDATTTATSATIVLQNNISSYA